MILGSRQRRQMEQLQNIERQLVLDDLDVAQHRVLRIARKAYNITGASYGTMLTPFLQHGSVFSDLVLAFLTGKQVIGINVFQPDKDAAHPRGGRLFDKVWNPMAQRVDLDREPDR